MSGICPRSSQWIKLALVLWAVPAAATASPPHSEDQAILEVLTTFMACISKKDAPRFDALFVDAPVAWVGVYKDQSQKLRILKNPRSAAWFSGTYQGFYAGLEEGQQNEEKFDNITVDSDGSVGSVIFDYSFWSMGNMINWGSEHWGLVKIDGRWRIDSVVFSMELTEVMSQPSLQTRLAQKRRRFFARY
jgi:hypothetical protein